MNNNKKINVFVDAHVFDGEHQGSRTFIRELYKRLCTYSDLAIFFAAQDVGNLRNNFGQFENAHFLKYNSGSKFKRLGFEIPSLIRKNNIDFAHFQYIVPPIKASKYIVTTHDLLFKDFPKEFPLSYRLSKSFLFYTSLLYADIITTVSEYSREAIHKHFGFDKDKISITTNGVSNLFYQPYDKQESKKNIIEKYGITNYILYVSRIEPRKKQTALLKAYLDLKLYERNIQLVLIGHKSIVDSELEDLLASMTSQAQACIFLLKDINDADLLTFYRASELFVYPSIAEGFGIPPLESAALKIPTFCSNVTAMRDFDFFEENHFYPSTENLRSHLESFFIKGKRPTNETLEQISLTIQEKYSWDKSASVLYQQIKSYH